MSDVKRRKQTEYERPISRWDELERRVQMDGATAIWRKLRDKRVEQIHRRKMIKLGAQYQLAEDAGDYNKMFALGELARKKEIFDARDIVHGRNIIRRLRGKEELNV